jgi:hypothetical protein
MTQTAMAQRQVLPTFSILAALSAVLWAATAVAHLAHTQSEDEFGPTGDYDIEGLFFGALLASAVALATIAPKAEGRTAKAGVWLAAVGHAMLAASASPRSSPAPPMAGSVPSFPSACWRWRSG